jgi:hypothetical protein
MNRYPWWKYAILAASLVIGLLYTLPNFFGEAPAVQVSSAKATIKVDGAMVERVQKALASAQIQADFVQLDGNSVKARFQDTDTQIKAKDAIAKALNADPADPHYIVALNLLSRSPTWMARIRALPMYLGLDLRGGVHFLMQVDMKSALTKKTESLAGDVRTLLRDKNIRHAGITRERQLHRGALSRRRHTGGGAQPAGRPAARHGLAGAARWQRAQAGGGAQARGDAGSAGPGSSSRTSPRCTTASTSSAWPSR